MPKKSQNLFSMFSDPDELLSLEPEELAGPLLLYLEGSDEITPKYVISFRSISPSLKSNTSKGIPDSFKSMPKKTMGRDSICAYGSLAMAGA